MAQTPALAQPRGTIKTMLEKPEMVRRFQQIVPRHLNPERMLRIMAQAVFRTPKLAECDPLTLLGAMQACASLGLEPNTPLGHAYLIPFDLSTKRPDGTWGKVKSVNLIVGYKGYVDLARRSGSLVSIHADVVYEGDDFDYVYGSGQHLMHRPRAKTEIPLEAYAYAKLTDGEAFEVLPYAKVLKIRDASQGYRSAVQYKKDDSPWIKHEHEMAAKTMVRRLAKWLPMSLEFANAVTLDAMSEAGKVDFSVFADAEKPDDFDATLAIVEDEPLPQIELQPGAPFDAQTGEVATAEPAKKEAKA